MHALFGIPQWKVLVVMAVCLVAIGGCATFGVPNQPESQEALEGAGGVMLIEYLNIKDDDTLSATDIANTLVARGDDFLTVTYPGKAYTFLGLVQERIADISKGKVNPQIRTLYYLIISALDAGRVSGNTDMGKLLVDMALSDDGNASPELGAAAGRALSEPGL